MAALRLEAISTLAEFERIGWGYEPAGENEIRCKCPSPAHDDNSPSVSLNIAKNVWRCHTASCGQKGDIVTFLALALEVERTTIIADLTSRYDDLVEERVIDPMVVERAHANISKAGPLLVQLRLRGITDEIIRKRRLGFWHGRITIPVYSLSGQVVNVRKYLPGAPGSDKMKNTRGFGTPPRIYMIEQITKYETLWFCGGEMKAAVAAEMLNPHGIGAFSVTAAEGTWRPEWNKLLAGKTVYLCFDIDNPGRAATMLVSRKLVHACRVFDLKLPLDKEKHPKGDINDWVGQEKATSKDFLRAQEASLPVQVSTTAHQHAETTPISVVNAVNPEWVNRKIGFDAVVSGFFETPFFVPKQVAVRCDRQQTNCSLCPVFSMELDPKGYVTVDISPTSGAIVEIAGAPAKAKHAALANAIGIPVCRSVAFDDRERFSVYDVRIGPPLSMNAEVGSASVRYPALIVDKPVTGNVPYRMTAVPFPHPVDQHAVLLVDTAEESTDSLESFDPTEEQLAELRLFQPSAWTCEALEEKLTRIYDDFAYNVTGVYCRQDMHLVMDLTWHSVLTFLYEGRVQNGWLDTLVIGDSSQGKTEASRNLQAFYALGDRIDCKNASAAGLIGGLQQIGNRWFVSWGVIPQNDRRMVLKEEAKGLSVREWGKMTEMRSSGVADIGKIERSKTNARTRKLTMTNVRPKGRTMSSYAFGVESIPELVGNPEDVRRFDVAFVVHSDEVSVEEINKPRSSRTAVERIHTEELCRRLVLFAWTRSTGQVSFDDDALDLVRKEATRLCNRFSESIPLLDRGTTHLKIMRLAAALASRTFSHTDYETTRVRACHVEFMSRWVDRTYSSNTFGYLAYTKSRQSSSSIKDASIIKKHFMGLRYPRDCVEGLLTMDELTIDDVMSLWSADREGAQDAMSLMVRKRCLQRHGRFHRKTPPFIDLLKDLQKGRFPKVAEDDYSHEEF